MRASINITYDIHMYMYDITYIHMCSSPLTRLHRQDYKNTIVLLPTEIVVKIVLNLRIMELSTQASVDYSLHRNGSSNFAMRDQRLPKGISVTLERVISMYITPVVILFGIVGNLLNILILTRKHAKGSSAMTMLCALSIMDMLVLLVQVPYIVMEYVDRLDKLVFIANAYFVCFIRYMSMDACVYICMYI
jgi:hypothetical protein